MRGSVIQSKQTPLLVLPTSTVLVSVIGFIFRQAMVRPVWAVLRGVYNSRQGAAWLKPNVPVVAGALSLWSHRRPAVILVRHSTFSR